MDRIVEYLLGKNKMEKAVAIIFFVFCPIYLIEFLYYREWFETMDIIKMTVLNIGILSVAYVLQMIIYVATLIFCKKGRTIDEILETPIMVLGIMMQFIVISRLATDNILHVFIVNLGVSVMIQIGIAYIYEKSLKIIENEG